MIGTHALTRYTSNCISCPQNSKSSRAPVITQNLRPTVCSTSWLDCLAFSTFLSKLSSVSSGNLLVEQTFQYCQPLLQIFSFISCLNLNPRVLPHLPGHPSRFSNRLLFSLTSCTSGLPFAASKTFSLSKNPQIFPEKSLNYMSNISCYYSEWSFTIPWIIQDSSA